MPVLQELKTNVGFFGEANRTRFDEGSDRYGNECTESKETNI